MTDHLWSIMGLDVALLLAMVVLLAICVAIVVWNLCSTWNTSCPPE